jgi:hypothetical protein
LHRNNSRSIHSMYSSNSNFHHSLHPNNSSSDTSMHSSNSKVHRSLHPTIAVQLAPCIQNTAFLQLLAFKKKTAVQSAPCIQKATVSISPLYSNS